MEKFWDLICSSNSFHSNRNTRKVLESHRQPKMIIDTYSIHYYVKDVIVDSSKSFNRRQSIQNPIYQYFFSPFLLSRFLLFVYLLLLLFLLFEFELFYVRNLFLLCWGLRIWFTIHIAIILYLLFAAFFVERWNKSFSMIRWIRKQRND